MAGGGPVRRPTPPLGRLRRLWPPPAPAPAALDGGRPALCGARTQTAPPSLLRPPVRLCPRWPSAAPQRPPVGPRGRAGGARGSGCDASSVPPG
eukprot:5813182-Pleurochrysis_carterae.AAC.1